MHTVSALTSRMSGAIASTAFAARSIICKW
jgi:hypothetical protein